MNETVARVRILELPHSADRCYDYAIPPALAGRIARGSLVTVPLGGTAKRTALVTSLADHSEYENSFGKLCFTVFHKKECRFWYDGNETPCGGWY